MKVFLVAGEASGDRLGASLIRGINKFSKNVEFKGVVGPEMELNGIKSLFDMSELSVMGLTEILPKYFKLKRRLKQTVEAVLQYKPDILITIDSPDFCLRVAKQVRNANSNIRTVHYVAPTVWAWRPRRAKKMAQFIDHVLALFPFEPPYMKAEGIDCDFVGHPIAALDPITLEETIQYQEKYSIDPQQPSLVVLPGSRLSEVKRLLPIFCSVLRQNEFLGFQLIFPTLPNLREFVVSYTNNLPNKVHVITGQDLTAEEATRQRFVAFSNAQAALAASGTVSLELAAVGTPMVIAYDMNWLSRWIISAMLRVDTVTLVNLISQSHEIPELLGKNCRVNCISRELKDVLNNPMQQHAILKNTIDLLGRGDTALADRPALAILENL
ncbi:MAG: lipid-A-disaccharide synthase [Planktomarina sp.]|nr:lipid-A-disaccharide synthase [Planktomarina sp.]